MADRKKRYRYDYLNDYKQDVSGQYRYVGDTYVWTSDRKASLRKMGLFSGLQVLLIAFGGSMPKAGMEGRFFSLLPFVLALVFVFVQVYCLGNLAMIKKEIKDHEYRSYFSHMGIWTMISAVAGCAAALGQSINVIFGLNGGNVPYGVLLIVVDIGVAAVSYIYSKFVKTLEFEKKEGAGS